MRPQAELKPRRCNFAGPRVAGAAMEVGREIRRVPAYNDLPVYIYILGTVSQNVFQKYKDWGKTHTITMRITLNGMRTVAFCQNI